MLNDTDLIEQLLFRNKHDLCLNFIWNFPFYKIIHVFNDLEHLITFQMLQILKHSFQTTPVHFFLQTKRGISHASNAISNF